MNYVRKKISAIKEKSELSHTELLSFLYQKYQQGDISQAEHDELLQALEEGNIKKITHAFLYAETVHKTGGLLVSGGAGSLLYFLYGSSLSEYQIFQLVLLGDTALKMGYSYAISRYLQVPHAGAFAALSSIPMAGKTIPLLWVALENKAAKVIIEYRTEKVKDKISSLISFLKITVV